MSRYDDIIGLPHHVSSKRTRMSMEERAAQFAPFAALSGYDETLAEAARTTHPRRILSDEEKECISERLARIIRDIPAREERTFVCFVPDRAKEGGEYVTVRGIVTGYDEYAKTLTLSDGRVLMIGDIQSVEI